MPKVLRPGTAAPQGPPPADLVATCPKCGAELETTSDEPTARASVFKDRQTKKPGWYIPCPQCGYEVFFERPGRH